MTNCDVLWKYVEYGNGNQCKEREEFMKRLSFFDRHILSIGWLGNRETESLCFWNEMLEMYDILD